MENKAGLRRGGTRGALPLSKMTERGATLQVGIFEGGRAGARPPARMGETSVISCNGKDTRLANNRARLGVHQTVRRPRGGRESSKAPVGPERRRASYGHLQRPGE